MLALSRVFVVVASIFFFSYAIPRFRPQNYNVDFLLLFLWSHDSWLNQYSTWWWTFLCDFEDRDDAQFICSDATRWQFISSWIGIITCIEFYHLWLIYSYSDHDRASVVGLLRKKGFCLLVTLLLFKVFFFPQFCYNGVCSNVKINLLS